MTGWWFGCHQFYFPIYWESHHPNWRTHIFSEGWPNHQPVICLNNEKIPRFRREAAIFSGCAWRRSSGRGWRWQVRPFWTTASGSGNSLMRAEWVVYGDYMAMMKINYWYLNDNYWWHRMKSVKTLNYFGTTYDKLNVGDWIFCLGDNIW